MPSEDGSLAESLHLVLARVFSTINRRDTSAAVTEQLTLAQLSTLMTLWEHGPMRMCDLAAHERVRTPTTTVSIRRLEKLGLVERSRDVRDLRAVIVSITPSGHHMRERSQAVRRAALADTLAKLCEEDRRALGAALVPLDRLVEIARSAGADRGA